MKGSYYIMSGTNSIGQRLYRRRVAIDNARRIWQVFWNTDIVNRVVADAAIASVAETALRALMPSLVKLLPHARRRTPKSCKTLELPRMPERAGHEFTARLLSAD